MRFDAGGRSACFAAMLLAAAVLSLFLWRDIQRIHNLSEQLTIERAQLSALQRQAAQARRDARKAQAGGEDYAPAGKPAMALLQAIEAAWIEDVSLLRLTADLPKSRLRLQIAAVSNDALFEFLARLKRGLGERVFIERQADRPAEDGLWRRDASVVVTW